MVTVSGADRLTASEGDDGVYPGGSLAHYGPVSSAARPHLQAHPADLCIWHGSSTDLSRRQSATTAGAPADQVRVCLAVPLPAPAMLEVAERAGNSVEVLLSRYAKCLDDRQDVANRRIAQLLGEDDDQEDGPIAGP